MAWNKHVAVSAIEMHMIRVLKAMETVISSPKEKKWYLDEGIELNHGL